MKRISIVRKKNHVKNDKMVSMKLRDRFEEALAKDGSITLLVKVVLILLVILLVLKTGSVWNFIWTKFLAIFSPFIIGFVIAYILRSPIEWGEKHHIKKGIMIAICYVIIFLFVTWLISSIVPLIISRCSDFINSMIAGVNWLIDFYSDFTSSSADHTWLLSIVDQATKSLESLSDIIPEATNSIPQLLSSAMSTTTNGIFAIIISIFMCIEWEKIVGAIVSISKKISDTCYECVLDINLEVSSYIKSLLILMLIKFVEYSIVYLIIGHEDWMILSLMTSLSLLIPYVGPTIVNCIGILTAISIPGGKVIILIILIVVLSQVDEYIIAPLVHSHNTSVTPLWALFSIFTGSALFGVFGLIIAIPAFLAIKVIIHKIQDNQTLDLKKGEE